MKEGKLDNEVLERSVLSKIKTETPDILLGPGVGEDCGAIRFGEEACVVTTDPITGATKGSGRLAVHVSCNDLASSGAEPTAVTVTILAPIHATLEDIEALMEEISEAAEEIGVAVIGGHTEVTSAVTRMVLSVTALGRVPVDELISTAGARAGDWIYMSKTAALEGTVIIAAEKSEQLEGVLDKKDLEELAQLQASLSVMPEGRIGRKAGVSAMHDITEGGVLGALWEVCEASGTGCTIWGSEIRIAAVTKKLSGIFEFNPLNLIGSGSMLMTILPDKAQLLEAEAERQGVALRRIGIIEADASVRRLIGGDVEIETIGRPDVDPLYRVLGF
ncbi:AIR synthase family protein [Acidaminobacter hydrogenoformans]|uniref:Hydrogenase maturation factor n=1 Tax=Acidaminobacter hydrogenoformans DSM 2784 TaxID=1120920 RepID=A0A1G5RZD5_9FIRM|nr:AIR synthase family protein [Acidaminobacter hydrogenoformans]SCZ78821.1 Hydrogenase maturation factor [Acidaminobacter hydrogenoformans DSM 2784]